MVFRTVKYIEPPIEVTGTSFDSCVDAVSPLTDGEEEIYYLRECATTTHGDLFYSCVESEMSKYKGIIDKESNTVGDLFWPRAARFSADGKICSVVDYFTRGVVYLNEDNSVSKSPLDGLVRGAVICYRLGDFNGDGIFDIFYRLLPEDGRTPRSFISYQQLPQSSETQNVLDRIIETLTCANVYCDSRAESNLACIEELSPSLLADLNTIVTLLSQDAFGAPKNEKSVFDNPNITLNQIFSTKTGLNDNDAKIVDTLNDLKQSKDFELSVRHLAIILENAEARGILRNAIKTVKMLTFVDWRGKSNIKDQADPLMIALRLSEKIDDTQKLESCFGIIRYLRWGKDFNVAAMNDALEKLLEKMAKNLSAAELALILTTLEKNVVKRGKKRDVSKLVKSLEEVTNRSQPDGYFYEIYDWLGGDAAKPVSSILEKYKFLIKDGYAPSYEDMVYVDKTISLENTRLLNKTFNISHFNRYSACLSGCVRGFGVVC